MTTFLFSQIKAKLETTNLVAPDKGHLSLLISIPAGFLLAPG